MLGKRGGAWGKGGEEVGETEGGKSGENVSFGCTGPHTEAIYDPSAIVYNVQSAPLTPRSPYPQKNFKTSVIVEI